MLKMGLGVCFNLDYFVLKILPTVLITVVWSNATSPVHCTQAVASDKCTLHYFVGCSSMPCLN